MMVVLLKSITCLVNQLPLPLLQAAGRGLGRLAYRIDRRHRDIALANLTIAFGKEKSHEEIVAIAVGLFENLGMNMMEFSRVPWLKRGNLKGYVRCEEFENLQVALKRGKGVIFITGHLGNWELMAAYCGLKGYPLDIVVRDLDSPLVDDFVRWVRTRSGNRAVSKGKSMRELLRTLRGGGIVGLLLDQNVTWSEGVFVDFFGKLACTNKGAALLAVVSGSPVIPAFIVREGGRHRIILGREIEVVNSGDRQSDMVENTYRFTRAIEDMVRRYPDQWFWIHQRWKSRPENDPRKGTDLAAPVQEPVKVRKSR
ncbi:MAG: lysophospholipid acyltransferase family protein [Deltaproteobacteria bacterium]|nr:lysophospholipid acyltransferase family protein [Deltaproteobacteria bacterium]